MKDYPRILTIQDISCVGQCSLTTALPLLSCCGVETCVLPSAVLSTHTGGFTGYTFRDLTDDMPGIADHWVKEGLSFEAIYTGYLGSSRQVDIVKNIMDRTLEKGGLKIVDPAMADGGKLYPGFDEEYVESMRRLCSYADIILPNITEACFLAGVEYTEIAQDRAYVDRLIEKLSAMTNAVIVLKGILDRPDAVGNAVFDPTSGNTEYYYTKIIAKKSHGTGDCYASVFTGALMRGASPKAAAALAAEFVVKSIELTIDDPDHWYGVKFEKAIPWLTDRISEITE